MLIFCFLVMMIDSFDSFSIAYVAPSIIGEWHVPRVAFTAVFTANVAGLALGAILLGMTADRFGNKLVLVVSLVAFGVLTYAKTLVGSVGALALLQFLAALPVGGAYPIALSIVAETTPLRRRAAMLVITSLGFTLGATLAGFIAAPVIGNLGWRWMFYIGAVLPFVLAAAAWAFVPDSLQRLAQHGAVRERIVAAIARIAPSVRIAPDAELSVPPSKSSAPVTELFADGRAAMTVTLWVGFIAAFMVYYFLFSWLPILLNAAGMSIKLSVLGGAIYPAGGFIGGLLFAYLSTRKPVAAITCALFVVSTLSIILIGFIDASLVIPALFLVGFGSVGGILASNALVSLVYPAEIRSTGIGWALGLGRFGSMLGPVLGGVMLAQKLPLGTMCFVMAVPALISAAAFFLVGRLNGAVSTLTLNRPKTSYT
ncbi:MAG: MFS transporter [Pseudomonadota bacterium]|nr:MFS transporter [Pseudomonadota bacterium]